MKTRMPEHRKDRRKFNLHELNESVTNDIGRCDRDHR